MILVLDALAWLGNCVADLEYNSMEWPPATWLCNQLWDFYQVAGRRWL